MDCTIIIPTRNRGYLLSKCLSELPVGYPAIVIDDGSDFVNRVQLDSSCKSRDNTVLLRHEVSLGACVARNSGAKHAKTEWLCFFDDDDQLLPDFFTKISALISEHTSVDAWLPDIVGCKRHTIRPLAIKELQISNRAGGCSGFLIRKSLFDASGGFDPYFPSVQDWDLWIRLSKNRSLYYSGILGVVYNTESSGKITYNLMSKYEGLRRLFFKHFSVWSPRVRRFHVIRLWTLRQLIRDDRSGLNLCLKRIFQWPLAILYYFKWQKCR